MRAETNCRIVNDDCAPRDTPPPTVLLSCMQLLDPSGFIFESRVISAGDYDSKVIRNADGRTFYRKVCLLVYSKCVWYIVHPFAYLYWAWAALSHAPVIPLVCRRMSSASLSGVLQDKLIFQGLELARAGGQPPPPPNTHPLLLPATTKKQ